MIATTFVHNFSFTFILWKSRDCCFKYTLYVVTVCCVVVCTLRLFKLQSSQGHFSKRIIVCLQLFLAISLWVQKVVIPNKLVKNIVDWEYWWLCTQ